MVVLINLPVPVKRDVTSPLSVTLSRLNFPPASRCVLVPSHGSEYHTESMQMSLRRTIFVAGVLDDR
jgi:hypothetical protein